MRTTSSWLFVVVCGLVVAGCGGDSEPEGEPLPAEANAILDASSAAMAKVTSVRFELERSGAVVFIDEFESLALDKVKGRFSAPDKADAVLTVTVDESLSTELGAVAVGGEVWLSNPVTGKFEVLDTGYDIDPATFFDPEIGWGPLMAELTDVVLVGVEDRSGKRYHVRGVAPAERMEIITAGLVRETHAVEDVEPHPGHARRYYMLTASGRKELAAEAARLKRTAALAEKRLRVAPGRT